jgi:hypothetical protein
VPTIAVGSPASSDNHTLWLVIALLGISCAAIGTARFRLVHARR